MTSTLGYKAARAACRSVNGLVSFGKRRNIASIQTSTCFASHHEPLNDKREDGTPAMSWRGISYCRTGDGVPLLNSSNESTSLLSGLSQIRFVGELWEEDDGG